MSEGLWARSAQAPETTTPTRRATSADRDGTPQRIRGADAVATATDADILALQGSLGTTPSRSLPENVGARPIHTPTRYPCSGR